MESDSSNNDAANRACTRDPTRLDATASVSTDGRSPRWCVGAKKAGVRFCEMPLFDSGKQRSFFTSEMKTSLLRKTGPGLVRTDRSSSSAKMRRRSWNSNAAAVVSS